MTVTFGTDSKTKVVLPDGKPVADSDRGIVKVRAVKGSDAAVLQTETEFEVIDRGSHTS